MWPRELLGDLSALQTALRSTRELGLVRPEWIAAEFCRTRPEYSYRGTLRVVSRYMQQKSAFPVVLSTSHARSLRRFVQASGFGGFGFPLRQIVRGHISSRWTGPTQFAHDADAVLAAALQNRIHRDPDFNLSEIMRFLTEYSGIMDVYTLAGENGPVSRSLLIVSDAPEFELYKDYFKVCEILPAGATGGVAVKTGFMFSLTDTCCCMLFDETEFPGFVKQMMTAGGISSPPAVQRGASGVPDHGLKVSFLSRFQAGENAISVVSQSGREASKSISSRRAGIANRIVQGDLDLVRKIPLAGDQRTTDAERIMIETAKSLLRADSTNANLEVWKQKSSASRLPPTTQAISGRPMSKWA